MIIQIIIVNYDKDLEKLMVSLFVPFWNHCQEKISLFMSTVLWSKSAKFRWLKDNIKNAAKPLITRGINTTHQHFQMWYVTLFQLKGLKSYQLWKFECVNFNTKIDFTFLLWLITFELLELKQSCTIHLKALICGIDAWGS